MYAAANQANLSWEAWTFEVACKSTSKGVVVVFQSDPGFELPDTEDVSESLPDDDKGYRDFTSAHVKHTEGIGGQWLVVHSDTHFF